VFGVNNYVQRNAAPINPGLDHRVDLISEALPFGGLWYLDARPAISYAKFRSHSHRAVIRVYDSPPPPGSGAGQ
jgi:hypothetical protein